MAGKLAGYELKRVIIGDRQQFAGIEVFGTSFVFRYGFGGLTVLGSSVKFSRLRYSIFALGGIMLQLVVIGIIFAEIDTDDRDAKARMPWCFFCAAAWSAGQMHAYFRI